MKCAIFPFSHDVQTIINNLTSSNKHEVCCVLTSREDCLTQQNKVVPLISELDKLKNFDFDLVCVADYPKEKFSFSYYNNIVKNLSGRGIRVMLEPAWYEKITTNNPIELSHLEALQDTFANSFKAQSDSFYEVNAPVIVVAGLSPNTNKFDTQVIFRNAFVEKGYKVSSIASNSLGSIIGMHSMPLPLFSNSVSFPNKVQIFKEYIGAIDYQESPDLIIVGVPGGIMPHNNKITNYFGEFAKVITSAVQVDVAILTIGFARNIDLESLVELKSYCRQKLDIVDCEILISNNRISLNSNESEYETYFLSESFIYELLSNESVKEQNATYFADCLGLNIMIDRIINNLSSNVCPIV